ncbi:MAG: hypothetical protein WC342_09995 [Methanoregula sp.]
MDSATIKKWVMFFVGILIAILIADQLSRLIMKFTGLSGGMEFIVSFILYAGFFFGIIYLIEKFFGIEYFGFGRS